MIPHYTFIDSVGSRVFHRWVDESGPHIESTSEFPLEVFIKSNRSDSKGIHGESLGRIEFSNVPDMREFVRTHSSATDIYGQTSICHQFISRKYPGDIEFSINDFTIISLDIEVAFNDEGFPHPSKARQEVTAITCKVFGKPGFVTFGMKPFKKISESDEYFQAENEKLMLIQFLNWWNRIRPDIVTGWNIEGFDIPYLINRLKNVLGDDVATKLSPFHTHTKKVFSEYEIVGGQISYSILGITTFDYLELYKKFSRGEKESYKLDYIASEELGEAKIDYSSEYSNLMDLYERNPQLYYEYNIHDVRLIEKMDEKLKYIFLGITIAFVGKVKLDEIFSQVKFWDVMVYNELLKQNIQIPPHKHFSSTGFEGAFVKDPIVGRHAWVVSLDLTSLYPSIIMGESMSPENIVRPAHNKRILEDLIKIGCGGGIDKITDEALKETDAFQLVKYAHDNNYCIAANGSMYRRDQVGIMPQITADMFAKRKAFKGKMLSAEAEVEVLKKNGGSEKDIQDKKNEAIRYDAMQNAYKIALNSLYGAQGNQYFRYFDPNIAEGITLTGQCVSRFIGTQLDYYLNLKLKTEGFQYVIAGDTDSVYISLDKFIQSAGIPPDMSKSKIVDFIDKFVKDFIDPFINSEFDILASQLNMVRNTLSMKREAIADVALWRGKKNYIIRVWDNEGVRYASPKMKMIGIETARSSTPKFVKNGLIGGYKILLDGTEDDLIKYVNEYKKEFMNAHISEIAFPRGVTDLDKWISGDQWKSGTPIHVKSALMYNYLIRKKGISNEYPPIKNGDKIKFIYLKMPNPTIGNVIGFLDDLPEVFGLNEYIDRETQFDKTFLHPLQSFSNLIGMSTEKRAKLDDLFGSEDALYFVENLVIPSTSITISENKVSAEKSRKSSSGLNKLAPKKLGTKKTTPTIDLLF